MKKFLGVLVALVIVVACVGVGAYYNGYLDQYFDKDIEVPESDFHYELEEPESATLEMALKDSEELSFDGTIEPYKNILKESNSAFLWFGEVRSNPNGYNEFPIESVSKKEFNKRMKNAKVSEEDIEIFNPCRDADELKAKAGAIIQSLTNTSETVKTDLPGNKNILVTYNESSNIECFDNYNVGENGEDKLFSREKLSLQCDNVEVGTLLCGDYLMQLGGEYAAKVSADITCKKNRGAFKDVSWIPAEGKTERVEFMVYFHDCNKGGFKISIVSEIKVLS